MNVLERLFLPECLRVKDVMACVKKAQRNLPNMQAQKQPLANPTATCAGNAEDLKAYISRTVFISSLKGCHPLAAECLFKAALSDGFSTDYVPVSRLKAKLAAYHQDDTLAVFKQDLARTNGNRASGLVALFVLIGVGLGFVASSVVGVAL